MRTQHTVDAAALVNAARAGDAAAQDALVSAYLPLVYNIVGRALNGSVDVDDVVQETMLRALGSLGGLRTPESFRSWLVAIAMNRVRAHWQDRRLVPDAVAESGDVADPGADFVDLTIVRLQLSGQRQETARATRWLEPDDREVLSLWWLECAGELTRAEVAAALAVSAQHTAVRVQRMKARLEAARVVVRALDTRPACEDLRAVLASWDGLPSALWRKRIARHARECTRCGGLWSGLLPAEGLLAGLALVAVSSTLLATMRSATATLTATTAAAPQPPHGSLGTNAGAGGPGHAITGSDGGAAGWGHGASASGAGPAGAGHGTAGSDGGAFWADRGVIGSDPGPVGPGHEVFGPDGGAFGPDRAALGPDRGAFGSGHGTSEPGHGPAGPDQATATGSDHAALGRSADGAEPEPGAAQADAGSTGAGVGGSDPAAPVGLRAASRRRTSGRGEARRRRRTRRRAVGGAVVAACVAGGGLWYFGTGSGPADTREATAARTPGAPAVDLAEPSAVATSSSPSASASPSPSPSRTRKEPSAVESPRPTRRSSTARAEPAAPTTPPRTSSTPQAQPAPTGTVAQVVALVKKERAAAGCGPVTEDPQLDKAAQGHSDDMAARGFFDHTDPDGAGPGERITAAGYRWSTYGENIAKGQQTPQAVMDSWMNSPGHRANILNCAFKNIGVGVHDGPGGPWWTQAFGAKL
ncbi:sigma-70 family RNA polymerase sigma factor [Streptomyces argyrophyllae]|uniref:RNA polymerase sigma factor n=1 Tax=Streptomyces argyrophylli TaxID=2726118 RepID=A0A6M4PQV0_9ACTN|nr:sigma-70 family RNA polymerase sigma factor [Streptomyces argyrophyllae]QJS13455.1 sigma-70 family RNA polymerase sigma factor [Streptomyces argyrophyllae]